MGKGGGQARRRFWRRSGPVEQRRRRRKGKGREADKRGRCVSGRKENEKEDGGAWAAAGRGNAGCWAAGPKGKVVLFFFSFGSLLFFLFKTIFSNQIQTKILQTFHKIL
jgi:hypothetical protein